MNCPVCGSEISAGVKYCPVCGTDVEGAEMRARQAAAPGAPTQQMPARRSVEYDRAPAQAAPSQHGAAVPMNSSMPPQQGSMRGFDTSKMNGSPKWPIVLICVLVVVIVAVLLLIFHPWSPSTTPADGSTTGTQGAATSTVQVGDGTSGVTSATDQPQVGDGTAVDGQAAASTLSNEEAYTQLTGSYDQLNGFHEGISAVAADFSNTVGVGDLTAIRDQAAALQTQIADAAAAVNALNVSADSPYASTKSAISSLYNDLAMRIGVLVEACNADIAGEDYSAILSRDNGSPDEHGHTNIYLIDYEQNYDAARPAQL